MIATLALLFCVATVTASKSDICSSCREAMEFVVPYLQNLDEWAQFLAEDLCEYLPEDMFDTCMDTFKDYFAKTTDWLVENVHVDNACSIIHLCPPTPKSAVLGCDFCMLSLSDLKDFLNDAMMTKVIATLAIRICGLLPSETMQTVCKAIAAPFVPSLIQMITESIVPEVTCGDIGLCMN